MPKRLPLNSPGIIAGCILGLLLLVLLQASNMPVPVTEASARSLHLSNSASVYVDNSVSNGAASGLIIDESTWPVVMIRVRNEHRYWTKISVFNKFPSDLDVEPNSNSIWAQFGYIPGNAEARYRVTFHSDHDSRVHFFVNAARSEDNRPSASVITIMQRTIDTIVIAAGGTRFKDADADALMYVLEQLPNLPDCVNAGDSLAAANYWQFFSDVRACLTDDQQAAVIAAIASRFGANVTTEWLKDKVFTPLKLVDLIRNVWDSLWSIVKGSYAGSVIFHSDVDPNSSSPPVVTPTPVPPPEPPDEPDAVQFVTDISIPDGTVLSPNQSFTKTWRLRNTGRSVWKVGYQLAFIGGHQMGAPDSIALPRSVAPGEEVNISVNMTAPSTAGSYQGDWKMRNAQGVYFRDRVWVKISVPGGPEPTPPSSDGTGDIVVQSVEYPSVVTPGQSFRPRMTVTVNQGQLLESRGDMLRTTDGNLYGAWPHVAVVGTVNAGQTYTFEFYENNPITAPSGEGTYESKWRVWRDGNWAGPEITIHFDVRSGGGTRPDPPSLVSPGNWHVSRDGSTPNLCASATAGLQYYFQIYESHSIPESGWISSNCWTPPSLGPYGYQWHVKVRDPGTGLESGWSETWHFNIESAEPTIEDVRFEPSSPSNTDTVRIYACVRNEPWFYVNTATDGSTNGEWKLIPSPPAVSCDPSNPNHWSNWWTLPFEDGRHRIRLVVYKNGENIVRDDWTYELLHRRPNGVKLVYPSHDIWLNDRIVTFRWNSSARAQTYNLVVATDFELQNQVLNKTLDANTTSFTTTFSEDYPILYWEVYTSNELGTQGNRI